MGNEFQLLKWYWWRNRFSITTLMLLSVIVAQTIFWMDGRTLSEFQEYAVGILLAVSMLASFFCAIEIFTDGRNLDLTTGKSAFPVWLFSLPVSSIKLALIPVVGMLVALAWTWMPFAWAISFVVMPEVSILDLLFLPWLGMCAAGWWLQVASWRPFRSGWHRLAWIVVAILLAAVLISLGTVLPNWYPSVAVIVIAAGGFAAALFSVTRARHEGWRSAAGLVTSESGHDSETKTVSLASFTNLTPRSAISAIRWHDWHRTGRFAVFLMLLFAFPLILIAIFANPHISVILLVLVIPTWMVGSMSTTLGKDSYGQRKFEMSYYLAALPVPNQMLLKSRIENVLAISLIMWTIALVVLAIWTTKSDNLQELIGSVAMLQQMFPSGYQSGWPIFSGCILLTLYAALVAPFPGMVVGLCGRKGLEIGVIITASTIGLVVVLAACFYATSELERLSSPEARSQYMEWMIGRIPGTVVGLLVAKIVVTAIGIWIAGKRLSISWNSISGPLLAGAIVCTILAVTFCLLIPTNLIPIHTTAMIVVLLFPCASLFLAPAAIDWNRHR